MKNMLRALLVGAIVGAFWGVIATERRHKQEAQARIDAFFNDPEVIESIRESERLRRTDKWLDDIEEDL